MLNQAMMSKTKREHWVAQLKKTALLVVGDVMLDRYWFGSVDRISPEAPVPIVRVQQCEERPGGAANVARNIVALGARAILLSVLGDDEAGRSLARCIEEAGIEASFQLDPQLPTTLKLRIVARNHQLLRADFENQPNHEVLAAKLAEYEQRVPSAQAVVLSDYGKGGLYHIVSMIDYAKSSAIPILVDPKGSDYKRYKGATLLTPNRSELSQVVGAWTTEAELTEKAQRLREELELGGLLLTRSEEGMTLFTPEGTMHIPTLAREVFDVTGAGDTVIGVLAAFLAAGMTLKEAVYWSNYAAGIVVAKLGTAVATLDELWGTV
jgi:D-glycero-beta-D-manno-heptose-7-phosphate kinase